MKIDKSNYEIWFIDWADNNLNEAQIEELNLFLEQNPDLYEEFNEINSMKLASINFDSTDKVRLKKSPGDLSHEQFDYLCIAFLEDDLTEIQKTEFLELKNGDPEKAEAFEKTVNVRLNIPSYKYQSKKKLLRKTPFERVARISWMALSAASAVTAFMLVSPLLKHDIKPDESFLAINTVRDTLNISIQGKITRTPEKKRMALSPKSDSWNTGISENKVKPDAGSFEKESINIEPIGRIPDQGSIVLGDLNLRTSLIVSDITFPSPIENDGRSNVGKFLARVFREKILNEKQVSDAPLKGYELAEAGIEGLNKLLGWEMALRANTDENGEVESVRFNSRILKFSAPVKKSDSAE
jgi:hypothetical protein